MQAGLNCDHTAHTRTGICFFVLANMGAIWYDATAVQADSAGSRTSQHKKPGTYMNKVSGTLCVSLVFVCRRFSLRFFMLR